ncbi:MAG: hypothetical protein SVW02_03725 [Candidatus Nanohaloarchaea archaeon]|nr:hypothetical protein [Candidatus Nanohaloarchaea archaeon]
MAFHFTQTARQVRNAVFEVLAVLLSVISVGLLLSSEQVLLATLIVIFIAVAGWRGSLQPLKRRLGVWGGPAAAAVWAVLTGILWFFLTGILPPLASSFGLAVTGLQGIGPPTLLQIYAGVLFLWAVYTGLKQLLRGNFTTSSGTDIADSIYFKVLVGGAIVVVFFFLFPNLFLQGKWANLGGIVGETGYGLESAFGGAGSAVVDAGKRFYNTNLDPSHNAQAARIVCAWELFGGGGVYDAASGSGVSMSKCVQQKIGKNETNTRSVKVTDPIELRANEPAIEPFSDHVEVQVPLTNTFVTDIRGRPIQIDAKDVQVKVTFQYLDKKVSHTKKGSGNGITVPPGDTRTMTFAKKDNDWLFPVKTVAATKISNDDIVDRLEDLKAARQQFDEKWNSLKSFKNSVTKVEEGDSGYEKNCKNGDGFEEGSGKMCADAYETELQNLRQELQQAWDDLNKEARWFVQTFKIDASDAKAHRIKFLAKAAGVWGTVQDANPCKKGGGGPCKNIGTGSNYPKTVEKALGGATDENYLIEGTDYRVSLQYKYTYDAEAAFTKSSRWRGGNQLLKVWRHDAWQELSFEERQAWQQKNCAEVKKYGQELPSKQRTASLTTPVTPVMYADCAASLFRKFGESGSGTVEITIGATVNRDSNVASLLKEEGGVKITRATTDCGGSTTSLEGKGWDNIPQSFSKTEGVGWIIDPAQVKRSVTIEGDRQTIGCQTDMSFRLTLQKLIDSEYTVPVIG